MKGALLNFAGFNGLVLFVTIGGVGMPGSHDEFMTVAYQAALTAYEQGEVPVGAALVIDGEVVAVDHNRVVQSGDPTAHAEVLVLRAAAQAGHDMRGSTLYVTLEPCVMCAGAIVLSRVGTLVYGADEPKSGAVRSLYTVVTDSRLNHRCRVVHGIGAQASAVLLRKFFDELRASRK